MTTPRHGQGGNSAATQSSTPSNASLAAASASKRAFRCVRCVRIPRCFPCTWNTQSRLLLFFVCYAVFLAPVIIALVREFYGLNLERKQENLLLPLIHPGGPSFLIALSEWLVMLLVVYLLYRVVGRRV